MEVMGLTVAVSRELTTGTALLVRPQDVQSREWSFLKTEPRKMMNIQGSRMGFRALNRKARRSPDSS